MSHSGSNPRRQTSTTQGYKSWSHGVTNSSIQEVNMLKNISTLAVSDPTNLSFKLCFVFVNGHIETYFVDTLRIIGRFHKAIILPLLENCINLLALF